MNNMLINGIIKSFAPTIDKLVDGGKIDTFVQDLKKESAAKIRLMDDECVEIMLTTEKDGREYVSFVVMDSSLKIQRVIRQMKLGELIKLILTQAKN